MACQISVLNVFERLKLRRELQSCRKPAPLFPIVWTRPCNSSVIQYDSWNSPVGVAQKCLDFDKGRRSVDSLDLFKWSIMIKKHLKNIGKN